MAMANENVVMDRPDDDVDSPGLWENLKDLFATGHDYIDAEAEELRYERRISDRRIEDYLDSHLPDYLRDFGILDEIALHVRDARVEEIGERTHGLNAFVRVFDEDVRVQEERMALLEKAVKKRA